MCLYISPQNHISNIFVNVIDGIEIEGWEVPRFAIAATEDRGPRPWRGFTHGLQTNARSPLRVRMRPDHEHGNGMRGVDMERGPDSV